MTEYAPYAATAILLSASLFFWGRGMIRSSRTDLIAGPLILVVLCIILIAASESSGAISLIGEILFVFGAATLVLSTLAKPDCPLQRRGRISVGAWAIFFGVCCMLVM